MNSTVIIYILGCILNVFVLKHMLNVMRPWESDVIEGVSEDMYFNMCLIVCFGLSFLSWILPIISWISVLFDESNDS